MAKDKYYDEPVEVTMPRKYAIKLKHILAQNPDADIEDVVRCKNCAKAMGQHPLYDEKLCIYNGCSVPDDYYCASGKRKDDSK